MTMDVNEIGNAIVQGSRQARFADVTLDEWKNRIEQLIASDPAVTGTPMARDVRPVGTAAGGSNGTYLFSAKYKTADGPVDRDLVLRFLPTDGLFRTYDVKGQFDLQKALERTDVPVPDMLWLDVNGDYLKRSGYIMSQCEGSGAPMTWMTSGLFAEASPGSCKKMGTNYIDALVKLHDVDWRAAGLQWLEERGEGTRPHEREINWYWDSLVWRDDKPAMETLGPVRDWLIANEPADVEIVLCHGDAYIHNYLFKDDEVSAVLDWEMAFLGARECDVLYPQAGDQHLLADVPYPEGMPNHEEMKSIYEARSGRTMKHCDYFSLFAFYRLAVINQLAKYHFSGESLKQLEPVFDRGISLCLDKAGEIGAL